MLAAHPAASAPVAYTAVEVDGGALSVGLAGSGPPLILLHGWTLDHRMWQPQVAGLAGQFTLVMPDRRGCGLSTAPPDLMKEARDMIAIANALGLERFALLGLSRGAVVALNTARRYASRVSAVAVSGAPLPDLVPRDETIDLDTYRRWAEAGDLAAFRADWAQHPLMRTCSDEAAALIASILSWYDGRDLIAQSPSPELLRDALAALPMPVLAMVGEHDTPWRRACAAALAQTARRGELQQIANAGHLASADNPSDFNAAILRFLATADTGVSTGPTA